MDSHIHPNVRRNFEATFRLAYGPISNKTYMRDFAKDKKALLRIADKCGLLPQEQFKKLEHDFSVGCACQWLYDTINKLETRED